jgi:hypothetical protein
MSLLQTMLKEDGTEMVLIHFVYRSPAGLAYSSGAVLNPQADWTWKLACSPNLTEMHAQASRPFPYHRSDDPRAVTCPACKDTEAFKDAEGMLKR